MTVLFSFGGLAALALVLVALGLSGLVFYPAPDASQVFQDEVTKTASFNGAWLDLGEGYAPGGLGQALAALVDVSALDATSGDETYTLKLQQAPDDGTGAAGTAEDIGPAVSVTATGTCVPKGFVTARFVRLVLTAGGTTPSITYSAVMGV